VLADVPLTPDPDHDRMMANDTVGTPGPNPRPGARTRHRHGVRPEGRGRRRHLGALVASVLAVASVTLVGGKPTAAAFRDINVEFTNRSDSELTLVSAELGSGCWVAYPPARVLLGQTIDIITESCGVLTGTEFQVTYRLDRSGSTLVLRYNNPAVGSDDFIELAPPGYGFESFGVIEDRTTRFICDSATCDGAATTTAELVEDGANDDDGDGGSAPPIPSGQTITFSLGGQTCSGITDAAGVASCSIGSVSADSLGGTTITTTFAGDRYYLPTTDTDEVIVFAFPARGAFVVGDQTVSTASTGSSLTWWHDAWYAHNSLSGGQAPSSFKGFAAEVTTLPTTTPADSCGVEFRTRPGSSPPPPAEVPSHMGVIVADDVDKVGNSVVGGWGRIVVVASDAGYRPVAGHPGTGTLVATFCP
jgi:hypothetical protein